MSARVMALAALLLSQSVHAGLPATLPSAAMPKASVTPSSALASFLAARKTRDVKGMTEAYDGLLAARLDAGQRGPSSELDLMSAVLTQDRWNYDISLARAGADLAFARRDLALLERARTREALGDVAAAERSYAAARAATADAPTRRAAIWGLARVTMLKSAAAAADLLRPELEEVNEPGTRWEGDLLLSRALAIQGKTEPARNALDRAFAEAAQADEPLVAITRVSHDLALQASDRARTVDLLSVGGAGALSGPVPLPKCDANLRPEDWVTLEIFQTESGAVVVLVRASRDGIAEPFVRLLGRGRSVVTMPVSSVTLRCRTTFDSDFPTLEPLAQPQLEWIQQQGYYSFLPVPAQPSDMEADTQTALVAQKAKLGDGAPDLIPSLMTLANVQMLESGTSDNQGYLQLARESLDRAYTLAMAAKAPAAALSFVRWQRDSLPSSSATPLTKSAMLDEAAADSSIPLPLLADLIETAAAEGNQAKQRATLDKVDALLAARHVPADDPIRQWVAAARIRRRHTDGDVGSISAIARAARLPADSCELQATSVSGWEGLVSNDDYPPDLVRRSVAGVSGMEFDVGRDGSISSVRLVVSTPPGLFDDAIIAAMHRHSLKPAEQPPGKPVACKAALRFRWVLPEELNQPGS